jgi:hypothetical protein
MKKPTPMIEPIPAIAPAPAAVIKPVAPGQATGRMRPNPVVRRPKK